MTAAIRHPRKSRAGETIGGGHFVFRRGTRTNRVRPSNWPFEYATPEAAAEEATRLAAANPGKVFQVFVATSSHYVEPEALPDPIIMEGSCYAS